MKNKSADSEAGAGSWSLRVHVRARWLRNWNVCRGYLRRARWPHATTAPEEL